MKANVQDHMKFKRLKRRLGKPQYQVVGVLESIWQLAGNSARAGDIGRFSDEDIALTIEWEGGAGELINALVDCGWLDRDPVENRFRLVVHDWSDHVPNYIRGGFKSAGKLFADQVLNGGAIAPNPEPPTIAPNSERGATNPIQSNPIQSKPPQSPQAGGGGGSEDEENPNIPEGGAPAEGDKPRENGARIMHAWNEGKAPGQPRCQKWTTARQRTARARLKEYTTDEIWGAIGRIARSKFCNGGGDRGWKADIDFLLRPDTVTKALEGAYDDRKGKGKRENRSHKDGGDWSGGHGPDLNCKCGWVGKGWELTCPHGASDCDCSVDNPDPNVWKHCPECMEVCPPHTEGPEIAQEGGTDGEGKHDVV